VRSNGTDKIFERGASPRNPFAIRSPEGSGAIGCSATKIAVDPVAGIGVETGWIGAETRIAAGGTIVVTVATVLIVEVAATTEEDDRTVVAGVAAGATNLILSSFSFHSLKSSPHYS
jgi:hypothetical protein